MSAAPVLEPMAAPRQCEQTGLSIPECCCRHCCEAQLRRYAPQLGCPSPAGQAGPPAAAGAPSGPIWAVGDFAAQLGITTVQLAERAYASEVPR
jgi:hypothetical protein